MKKRKELIYQTSKNVRTHGQKAADKLTKFVGSWIFIFLFFAFLFVWIFFNSYMLVFGVVWDKKPFIMLNLILSCLAAIQAPIILMGHNRQAEKDRLRTEYDYQVDKKAEKEIQNMQKDLKEIKSILRSRK